MLKMKLLVLNCVVMLYEGCIMKNPSIRRHHCFTLHFTVFLLWKMCLRYYPSGIGFNTNSVTSRSIKKSRGKVGVWVETHIEKNIGIIITNGCG